MRRLTLFLDWELNCQFAGLIWALDAGLFQSAGVDLRVIPPSDQPGQPVLQLLQDAPGAVCTVEENLAIAAASQTNVRAIGAMLQRSPLVLMTAQAGPVKTLADLPGRRVAMHADGAVHLRALLSLQGIDPDAADITVGGWTLDDLAEGQFDAAQGYAITEARSLAALGYAARLVPLHAPDLSPSSIVLVTHADTIAANGAALGAMLRALAEGWDQVLTQPQAAARCVAAWSSEHPDVAENEGILKSMVDLIRRHGSPTVQLNPAQWARNIHSLSRLDALPAPSPRLKDVIDTNVFGLT